MPTLKHPQQINRDEHDNVNLARRTHLVASSATINAVVNTGAVGTQNSLVTLLNSDAWVGLATVTIGAGGAGDGAILDGVDPGIKGSVISTASGNAQITYPLSGPTVYAVVNTGAAGTQNSLTTLNAGPNQIGSVTISNDITIGAALPGGSNYIGLATVNVGNEIGSLATVTPSRSATTSFSTVISGTATIFGPPAGQTTFVHDLLINAQGATDGALEAGGTEMIPFGSLATSGGFVMNYGNPGKQWKDQDDDFGVLLNSAATVSVYANVHFE